MRASVAAWVSRGCPLITVTDFTLPSGPMAACSSTVPAIDIWRANLGNSGSLRYTTSAWRTWPPGTVGAAFFSGAAGGGAGLKGAGALGLRSTPAREVGMAATCPPVSRAGTSGNSAAGAAGRSLPANESELNGLSAEVLGEDAVGCAAALGSAGDNPAGIAPAAAGAPVGSALFAVVPLTRSPLFWVGASSGMGEGRAVRNTRTDSLTGLDGSVPTTSKRKLTSAVSGE